jgi:hypothetical protein
MLQDHNRWLAICFATYVVLIFVFAFIYYALYRQRPQRFFFATGVQDSQTASYELDARKRLLALATENEALAFIQERVSKGASPQALAEQRIEGSLPSGCYFALYLRSPGSTSDAKLPTIELRNTQGEELARVSLPQRWPWEPWDEAFLRRRHKNLARAAILEKRLLSAPNNPYDVWSYWDFLYFSSICQTTVGFGDILPNATPVRLLVVTQIVLGYGVLVVLLNIVFHP